MSLESAYKTIRAKWVGDPQSLESFETAKAIQNHRDYWKPDKVCVVLLAESHVFTSDAERKSTRINLK